MQTIHLRVNEKIYKQLMWFLSKFSVDELQVIREDEEYTSVKDELERELKKVESDEAETLTLDELDRDMEAAIRKYEA
jgi:hypothetical protein